MSEEKIEGPRNILVLLDAVDGGTTRISLDKSFHQMTRDLSVRAKLEGKKLRGVFTVAVSVTIDPKGVAELVVNDTVKVPPVKRLPATLWVSQGGNVVTEPPRQERLPLRDVSAGDNVEPINRPAARDA